VLKKNPSIKLQIQGNSDSKGSEAYNLILSKKGTED
jgi:outer membrane protein OmpA-like peptidoglycan-associated protein